MAFSPSFLPNKLLRQLLLLALLHFTSLVGGSGSTRAPLPGCPESCGLVQISYPFGIGNGCFLPGFEVECNQSIPFLAGTGIRMLDILNGQVRIDSTQYVALYCPSPLLTSGIDVPIVLPKSGPYTFSVSSSRFRLIGCNVIGTVKYDSGGQNSCATGCNGSDNHGLNSCNGNGCCETSFTQITTSLHVHINSIHEDLGPHASSCSYGILSEDGSEGKNTNDIVTLELDWAIGEESCEQATTSNSYVCGQNATCIESERSMGYLCECSTGHAGNPYISGPGGCEEPNAQFPSPSCPKRCGSVEIIYPFGIGSGCFFPGFEVICNKSIPFLADMNLQLLEILPAGGEVRVSAVSSMAEQCTWPSSDNKNTNTIKLPEEGPFTVSGTSNKFIVIGCNAEGTIIDGTGAVKACLSRCTPNNNILNGSCIGQGCCETSLPGLQKTFQLLVRELGQDPDPTRFLFCSFGVIADGDHNSFDMQNIRSYGTNTPMTMKLEWAIGEGNCAEAVHSSQYICGGNTSCVNSDRGSGYLCKCSNEYEGNPYCHGSQGCQDIDECESSYALCVPKAKCENQVPGYRCVCPKGSAGDGRIRGTGCRKPYSLTQAIIASLLSAGFAMLCVSWFYWARRKRKLINLRAEYFRRNGGLLLEQHFSFTKSNATKNVNIYSAEELKRATDNYNNNRILGSGGHGTVYKGILQDGTIVAIKKSQVVAQNRLHQFINELNILSQINHRNIVKLLGFCLETQVPMLVYEFISNGTLYQELHGDISFSARISWRNRLLIATEIAEALSYLHCYASMPIFHRDVKSSNILLDKDYTAKLADFGISRLMPLDKKQVSTVVQGTIGYLDPEYFTSGKLTDKSDVYSFGVVLLELLTGRGPIQDESTQDFSPVLHFLSHVAEENIAEILEPGILEEGRMEELLAVVKIARRCLSRYGQDRPPMKKVMQELALIGN